MTMWEAYSDCNIGLGLTGVNCRAVSDGRGGVRQLSVHSS